MNNYSGNEGQASNVNKETLYQVIDAAAEIGFDYEILDHTDDEYVLWTARDAANYLLGL